MKKKTKTAIIIGLLGLDVLIYEVAKCSLGNCPLFYIPFDINIIFGLIGMDLFLFGVALFISEFNL